MYFSSLSLMSQSMEMLTYFWYYSLFRNGRGISGACLIIFNKGLRLREEYLKRKKYVVMKGCGLCRYILNELRTLHISGMLCCFCVSVGDLMHSITVELGVCAKIPVGRVCQGSVRSGGSLRKVSWQLHVTARLAGQGHHGMRSHSSQVRATEQNWSWGPVSHATPGWSGRDVGTKVGF